MATKALTAGSARVTRARQTGRCPRPARGQFGAWRAVLMLPAIIGGVLLMLALTAGLRAWAAPTFLLWLAGAGVVSTRWGERLAVRTAYGFRPLSGRERQLLEPMREAALARCDRPSGELDWYTQPGRQPNARVAGRRSIAVTDGALASFLAGRLPADLLIAVLIHELGHHATGAGRFTLAAGWLAAPGRLGFRIVLRLAGLASSGRRPGRVRCAVVAVGGGIAITHAVQQQHWAPALLLAGIAAALVATPLLDSVVSRASEHAADRYAASMGAGPELARALAVIDGTDVHQQRRRWGRQLLDRHPSLDNRVAHLSAGSAL